MLQTLFLILKKDLIDVKGGRNIRGLTDLLNFEISFFILIVT